ncbi:hypothetical protein A4H97_03370 [Niastella yeongjuensis]|uniref:Uncharacterized protein n=1 Tax=Niastella yeongjuensis TaxID=354355 RepID=A0A1V9EYY1_9BACT|nr:hypothetical protein A4H97_03370 [Niastella yeongjuensis]
MAYLILTSNHSKTNNTKHYVGGQLLTDIRILAICKYEDAPGYYLFYCGADWNEFTDTYHDSIEDAIDQAEFEFANTHSDWIFTRK